MRFFISKYLGFGLRAGVSTPIRSIFGRNRVIASPIEFVYVIAGEHGLVKVGITTNMQARLATLRTASPFRLKPHYALAVAGNAAAIEYEAHRRLASYRQQGEWFDCTPATAEAIVNEVATEFGIGIGMTDSANFERALARVQDPIPAGAWDFILFCALASACIVICLLTL